MKHPRSHFVFSKSEQNGIFLLVLIIIGLQLIYFFVDFSPEITLSGEDELKIEKYQNSLDSLKSNQPAQKVATILPFNPNYITDFKGYVLGMKPEEIDKLLEYRKTGKYVNSAKEFQQVTGISDSLLQNISPYFKFPDWVNSAKKPPLSEVKKATASINKKDLNTASTADLMEIKGIGEVLGARIVNYRNKIGSFRSSIQLKDIYGLNYELRELIDSEFFVAPVNNVLKLDINTATVLQLSEIPYFNYELAREIVNYRLLHEKISTFEELAKIKDFPSEKIDRIALYLTLK